MGAEQMFNLAHVATMRIVLSVRASMKLLCMLAVIAGVTGCIAQIDEPSVDVAVSVADEVIADDGLAGAKDADIQPAAAATSPCETPAECGSPPAAPCLAMACDPSGRLTDPGMPAGCHTVPAAPGAACSYQKGIFTCPGTCSGSAPMYDCEPLEPQCGGY